MNWGLISDGGMFESLVHCLLFAQDSGTLLFGRPGKDSGQDARSTDRKTVYQAKFSASGLDINRAVKLALGELESIKKYKDPKHPNYKHWEHVENWILVANIAINPNDEHNWQKLVFPAFKAEGLKAEYWSKERLEKVLAKHSWISDVFFEGENRVLIGLKEARDLLEAESVDGSLEIPFLGRENGKKQILDFVTMGAKKILPIVGPIGIGKTRLFYESLADLAEQEWRTLWGLPISMARSSKWFRLLNGSQKTVVVLDGIGDKKLLRVVMEQLATTERKNWKVLISCGSEEKDVLDELKKTKLAEEPVSLEPLSQDNAKLLVSKWYGGQREERDYQIYKLSNGIPGWIALVGASFQSDELNELPKRLDSVAKLYVQHCLDKLLETKRENAKVILRYLALWERLTLTPDSQQYPDFQFLKDEWKIEFQDVQSILKDLVRIGLVKNFGIGKRLYSIGQLIVRHQILADWILEKRQDDYVISPEGIKLVDDLTDLKIPNPNAVMFTLAQLSCSRLDDSIASKFLKPVFEQLKEIVRKETVVHQDRVLDLVEKGGPADPEIALEVLMETRKSPKPDEEVGSFWGKHTYTHRELISRMPWMLYCLAEFVHESADAKRFLKEFEWLILNADAYDDPPAGKQPAQLLSQLLSDSRRLDAFGVPAFELALQDVEDFSKWPFVEVLVETLMNPSRESAVWTASSTISFQRSVILPVGSHWDSLKQLRQTCFETLENSTDMQQRVELWDSLRSVHYSLNHAAIQSKLDPKDLAEFDQVLISDLERTKKILEMRGIGLEFTEATAAQEMWEWYLNYAPEEKKRFIDVAANCEKLYRQLSNWDFRVFFSYDSEEKVAPERRKVVEHLVGCSSSNDVAAFFGEAEEFLSAGKDNSQSYDRGAIVPLAKSCSPSFSLDEKKPATPVTGFVREFLSTERFEEKEFTFSFVLKLICEELKAKKADGANYLAALKTGIDWASDKSKLIEGVYTLPHRDTLGELKIDELDLILAEIGELEPERQFQLLTPFLMLDCARVLKHLESLIEDGSLDQKKKGDCILGFVRVISTMSNWWEWKPSLIPVNWIFDAIQKYDLSGEILEDYQLNVLRKRSNYRLPISKLCSFIRSRKKFDQNGPPFERFAIFPYDFKVADWCGEQTDPSRFAELCELTQDKGFVATYLIPKWIAKLDPSGTLTSGFVQQSLEENTDIPSIEDLARLSYLAAPYADQSDAWKAIAKPICARAADLNRDDRDYIFKCLENNDDDAYYSMPGEVAGRYVDAVERAKELLQYEPSDSPLIGYRKRALENAKHQLDHERERIEEDLHGSS